MKEKKIKRNNENFKCTLISNLSFRMSKLERKKKDGEKKRVMREERGKRRGRQFECMLVDYRRQSAVFYVRGDS